MMKAIRSSQTSFFTRTTRLNFPEDGILHSHRRKTLKSFNLYIVIFEVFTAVTMKNGVFWDVTTCGSCKNRRFGGTWRLLHRGGKNQ
jgi:hypothetical protein